MSNTPFEFINNQRWAELAGVNYDSEQISPGPIAYSRTHCVVDQFPLLATFDACILLTSFSDGCVTQDMADLLPANVTTWFSNNVSCIHPRVRAIPIGYVYNIEREKVLSDHYMNVALPRENLVYMNFTKKVPRAINPRAGLYEKFQSKKWVTTKGGVSHASVAASEFYTDLRSHDYCLSPDGAGPDCHRHWEAMVLGCIPIVLRSQANELLEDMPALRVNSWDHVTEETLRRMLPDMQKRFTVINKNKCGMGYWRKKICTL